MKLNPHGAGNAVCKLAILGTRGIPALYGGFETFAEELSVRLVQRGVEVTVYCEAGDGELAVMYRGVHLVHIPAPRLGPLTTIVFDLRCLWHARKMFAVVYMLGYGAGLFCFLPRLWGSTVWINMDGIEWARSKWGRLAKIWFKLMEAVAMWTPDRVIADAHGILRHLDSRHAHMPAASVIPYGAPVIDIVPDARLLEEWQLTPGQYYLVVCRLEPENSVREIIQGYLRSDSRLPLIVVGSLVPATAYVNNLLQVNDSRIHFIGPVYEKKKLLTLRFHALAYAHGHTVGGTNPSLLEALGCGSLIIARDNVFNREVAGPVAMYFNNEIDIPELIKTIEAYSSDKISEIRMLAIQRVSKCYNWDIITDQYFILLNEANSELLS